MTDDADGFAKAFVVHNEMEQTRAYLERGRRFEHMPVEALNEGWAAAFKLVLLPKDQRRPSDQHDFGAELRLRGLEIPYHLVQDAMNELRQRIRDNREAARDSLLEDLGRFLDEMDNPKN